jgi:hypothetical protein
LPFLPGEEKSVVQPPRDLRAEFFGKEKRERTYLDFLKK